MPFTLTMPKLSPTMEEGMLVKWHKQETDFVKAQELLFEVATDKATIEYHALDEGWLRKCFVQEGASVAVGTPLALFTLTQEEPLQQKDLTTAPTEKVEPQRTLTQSVVEIQGAPLSESALSEKPQGRIYASPLARKLAVEKGIPLSTLRGTGPGGRITSRDVPLMPLKHAVSLEEPLTPMRKTIAARLQLSKSSIPHFYIAQTLSAGELVSLREQLKAQGIKVTFNDLILKATASALKIHPEINVGFNTENYRLIRFDSIDIAVAVTVEGGVITPVIRHADQKTALQIKIEMEQLAAKARKGTLREEEYQGGSFCISNLGMFGISAFTAVINPPQGAILAVGAIEEAPVIRLGQIACGYTLTLTLSCDHRVIDGALAARFIKTLQQLLEAPASLIL